jgi:PRTRC genetic system protein B
MVPIKALVLYTNDETDNEIHYAEITEYQSGIPNYCYPATKEFFKEIGKSYLESNQQAYTYSIFEKGKPVKMIAFKINGKDDSILFMTSPQKRMILFQDNKHSGYYPLPALVWKANKTNNLRVFAVTNHQEINEKSPLFMAPFMNLASNGSVCLGSSYWPESFKENIYSVCKVITNSFFDSKFTHFNVQKVTQSNYFTLFDKLKKMEKFPEEELVGTEYNMTDLINGLL